MTETLTGSKPDFRALVSGPERETFLELAARQSQAAQRGLDIYMEHIFGQDVLTSAVRTTNDYAAQMLTLRCEFTGKMTPEQFQHFEPVLVKSIQDHPVLGPYEPAVKCTRGENGEVHLQATVAGLNAQEHKELIDALADLQHLQDSFETNNGFHQEGRQHTHDHMQAAANALKQLAARVEKHAHAHGGQHVPQPMLDLRTQGQIDRAAAEPKLGAYALAARRKRSKGAVVTGPVSDDNPEFCGADMSDTEAHLEEHGHHGFHPLEALTTIFKSHQPETSKMQDGPSIDLSGNMN